MLNRVRVVISLLVAGGVALAIYPLSTAAAHGAAMPFSVMLEPGQPANELARLPKPSGWTDGDETLHWDSDPDRGFNINGTYSYGCAQRYTETTGVVVKAILYYLTGNADDVFVYAAGESTMATPGAMLDTTRASGLGGGIWKRANMPHPPVIEPYKDFWACVIVRRHPSGQYPLTLDLGPIIAWRGGYITLPSIGPDWYQLTDPPFWTDRNCNIRAVVERTRRFFSNRQNGQRRLFVLEGAGELKPVSIGAEAMTLEGTYVSRRLTTVDELVLSVARCEGEAKERVSSHGSELLLVHENSLTLETGVGAVTLGRGEMAVVPQGIPYRAHASETAVVLMATKDSPS